MDLIKPPALASILTDEGKRVIAKALDAKQILLSDLPRTIKPEWRINGSLAVSVQTIRDFLHRRGIRLVVTVKAPSAEREMSLAHRFKKTRPGNAIEAELAEEYIPLVKTVVGRLAMSLPPHVDIEDLYSSGLVGLINGIRNYNPDGGSSFKSYASVRIRGAVYDELRRLDWVPRSIHTSARKVQEVTAGLEQSLGRTPSNKEVAEKLDLTPKAYEELLIEIRPATYISLDSAPVADEEGETSRHDSIEDSTQESPLTAAERREMYGFVREDLEQLPEAQRKVLALYYFEDLRLWEIARIFGVTESRICQIHAQGVLSLRDTISKRENYRKVGI
jgi:RNA polymerase sigma factor for flagellar operon FliA